MALRHSGEWHSVELHVTNNVATYFNGVVKNLGDNHQNDTLKNDTEQTSIMETETSRMIIRKMTTSRMTCDR